MIDNFIKKSNDKRSAFFLNDYKNLILLIDTLKREKKKTLFIGVSFGLLDLVEKYNIHLDDNFIVMETGGMKGNRKEIIRNELHSILKKKLNIPYIHSEYGMTELLSQAYSQKKGIFEFPKWCKILIRDINDPLNIMKDKKKSGGINIIDLANINSCSFISTQDIGILKENGFEVLGRIDNSDIRGCNLIV